LGLEGLTNQAAFEELKASPIPVLDKGYLRVEDVMGDDRSICRAAWTTSGVELEGKGEDDYRRLIHSLMRRREMSPFEFAQVVIEWKVPLHTWGQVKRYRTASMAERSNRYREALREFQETGPGEWRKQSDSRKQGSAGFVTEVPEGTTLEFTGWENQRVASLTDDRTHDLLGMTLPHEGDEETAGAYLSARQEDARSFAVAVYDEAIRFGVAKEQARACLPQSLYTQTFWRIDLRNALHVLTERVGLDWVNASAGHAAQHEAHSYASAFLQILERLFPITLAAFKTYVLGAVTLSTRDREAIGLYFGEVGIGNAARLDDALTFVFGKSSAEREECRAKLHYLGFPGA
jgi:thymidylate synthase (FAD)